MKYDYRHDCCVAELWNNINCEIKRNEEEEDPWLGSCNLRNERKTTIYTEYMQCIGTVIKVASEEKKKRDKFLSNLVVLFSFVGRYAKYLLMHSKKIGAKKRHKKKIANNVRFLFRKKEKKIQEYRLSLIVFILRTRKRIATVCWIAIKQNCVETKICNKYYHKFCAFTILLNKDDGNVLLLPHSTRNSFFLVRSSFILEGGFDGLNSNFRMIFSILKNYFVIDQMKKPKENLKNRCLHKKPKRKTTVQ